MLSHIFFDKNRIYIRITVFTQMSTSIIGTYIYSQKTCAFPISLIFLSLWNFQSAMESCLKCMNSHTSDNSLKPSITVSLSGTFGSISLP